MESRLSQRSVHPPQYAARVNEVGAEEYGWKFMNVDALHGHQQRCDIVNDDVSLQHVLRWHLADHSIVNMAHLPKGLRNQAAYRLECLNAVLNSDLRITPHLQGMLP
ncbi:hypothetical protein D3C87_1703740 [compost metagenome]